MSQVSISCNLTKTGNAGAMLIQRINALSRHGSFSLEATRAFADTVERTAPRDTGYMISRMTVIRSLRSAGNSDGHGVGAYALIGYPSHKANPGRIAAFIRDYPKLRGRPPVTASGAWWTLEQAGKEKLRAMRHSGSYGGARPMYWYAIAEGLVPNATGGTLRANDFVTPAIERADQVRRVLSARVFGA